MNSDGTMYAINNATNDSLGAYTGGVWYRWSIKVTSFASKTYQVSVADCSVDCSADSFSANKTFRDNLAESDLGELFLYDNTAGHNVYFDDIGPAAPVVDEPNLYESGSFFHLLKRNIKNGFVVIKDFFINKVYAKTISTN